MNTKINKSDFIVLAIYYSISVAMQIYDYAINDNDLIEFLVDIPSDLIVSLVQIFLFIFWLIPSYIVKEKKYIHFVVFSLLSMIILGGINYTLGFWSGSNPWHKFPSTLNLIIMNISRMAESVGLPFGVLLAKKYYEGQIQYSNIEKQQKENELKLLRSQIDPHFLFNNLNTLDALIDSNPSTAKEYINRLSLIYRYLIKTKDAEVMELSYEVDFAENYIFLIQTRFTNDYNFNIITNNTLSDKFIPTGALQTLLENVVKHNKVLDNTTIKTTILIEDDWLTVTNSKSNLGTNSESLGTGLNNLKARYELLIDKNVQVINTNTEYKISIPIIKLSNEN
ncbi:sensor histidine kinase [uncultured Lacinutrix sp.]|uniref:sensor histidine kinase n=1 Tax=uncultured Lacinutrix sp. TaxID=574032 RepID=UPI00261673E7|nr:histidine kinase [uncultured Lacinutrix sp.]